MTRTHLYHSAAFDLVSYGNGSAYWLHDNVHKRSLYAGGDDAAELRSEIEAWERIDPEKPYDDIYAEIMSEYESVTTEDTAL